MRMGQAVRTDLGHGGITCVLQTQFSSFLMNKAGFTKPKTVTKNTRNTRQQCISKQANLIFPATFMLSYLPSSRI